MSLRAYSRTFSSLASSKVWPSVEACVADVPSNSRLLFGGFGLCGIPENLITALSQRPAQRT